MKNGERNGLGRVEIEDLRHFGYFKNDEIEGLGEQELGDGSKVSGWFVEGILDGFGVSMVKLPDGGHRIERGYYLDGLKDGWIRETSSGAQKPKPFESEHKNKKLNKTGYRDLEKEVWLRHGKVNTEHSWTFSGEYSHGYRHGLGILRKDQGRTEIRGNWISGNLDGFCIKRVKGKGSRFRYLYQGDLIGNDKDGNMHGIGRFQDKGADQNSSALYIGVFENGQRNGFGQYKDKDTLYVGGWNFDQKNGVGFQKYHDESSYFGYWLNNTRDGLGLWLANDGKEVRGEWKNDKLHGRVYIRVRDSDQSMFVMYRNGKMLEHLQYGRDEFLQEFDILNS